MSRQTYVAKLLGIAVLCVAVALCGCQMDTDAHTVREFQAGKQTVVQNTQYAGRYQLYKIPDHARSELDKVTTPVFSTHLDKKQLVGFKIDQNGKAIAVAGNQTVALEAGRYQWVMNADPGQIDDVRTAVAVVVIGVVVVVAAVAVFALLLESSGAGTALALSH